MYCFGAHSFFYTSLSVLVVQLDLVSMRKGMAFVNGAHVANYDIALASCVANGTMPMPGQPNSFPGEAHWKPNNWCGMHSGTTTLIP